MKSKILFGLMMAMILIAGSAEAILMPMPIAVKVPANQYCEITITNTRTGSSVSGYVKNGEYLTDWANIESTQVGDVFSINVEETMKEIIYPKNGYAFPITYVDADCTSIPPCPVCGDCPTAPDCPVCDICEDVECGDCNGTDCICSACPDLTCPDVPACPTCSTCQICEEPEPCAGFGIEYIITLIIALFAVGGGGAVLYKKKNKVILSATKMVELIPNGDGIKIYKSRDGKQVVVLHKHPGIRGYHNPSTRHKDPNERHDPDNIAPDFN